MTKLTKELFEGHTYGELVKLTGLTDREVHVQACRLGLIDPKTPMGQYWMRCVERADAAAKIQANVVANAAKSAKAKAPAAKKATTQS